eukprot:2454772-Pleurochrysis_carterae.AAC.1
MGISLREKRSPTERWCDKYIRTLWAAQYSSSVGQLMARQSMTTAKATSGRVCVEQYRSAPTRD